LFSYIWLKAKDERALAKLSIASWSKKCQRSEILKCGTDEDKAKLKLKRGSGVLLSMGMQEMMAASDRTK
jgi:hypothetical protein